MSLQNLNNPSAGGSGGSGLSSVSADAPLSGSGTSGSHLVIANASGAAVGVVQLTGDFGGTATAPTVVGLSHVTNASLLASGIAGLNPNTGWDTGSAILSMHPSMAASALTTAAGSVYFTEFLIPRSFAIGSITLISSAAATGSPTVVRAGLFTVSGTTYTIVARTAASDLTGVGTFLKTANTVYTVALDITGSFPATYTPAAGSRLALGVCGIGTSAVLSIKGAVVGAGIAAAAFLGYSQTARISAGGQTDLPTTVGATLAGGNTGTAPVLVGLS